MKILCIASSAPGHIDFGGGGFVTMAQALEERGHQVKWLTYGEQAERLGKKGCIAEGHPAIGSLGLYPFFPVGDIESNLQQHQINVESIKQFHSLLLEDKPDLLLIDRLLVYAGLVASELEIPYLAIGTPGGHWNLKQIYKALNVYPSDDPVDKFNEYGGYLKDELAWTKGELDSFWLNSPFLNICFMSQEFYPLSEKQQNICANVYHHQNEIQVEGGRQIGLSFGNQGRQEPLLTLLEHIVTLESIPMPLEVFVGTNEILYEKLSVKYSLEKINLHKWVDFGNHFKNLSCLIFLGGVGTIWRCIDNGLPMLILPGNIGDQLYNAERVESIGAGIHLEAGDIEKGKISSALAQCIQSDTYQKRYNEFSLQKNYSDTLGSLCERIENI